jgi:hypothetical protein
MHHTSGAKAGLPERSKSAELQQNIVLTHDDSYVSASLGGLRTCG